MGAVSLMLIGVATSINLIVIKFKLEKGRFADAFLDGAMLVILTLVFGGSYAGLTTAVVASSIISTYLWFSPPKLGFSNKKEKTKDNNIIVRDLKQSIDTVINSLNNHKT